MIAQLNHMAHIWWQWMGGMFWQVGLLIILVTLIDMAIRRWAWPQVRYVLWGLVFLKLVIPPTWQMPTSVVSWLQTGAQKQISIRIETGDMNVERSEASETFAGVQSRGSDPSGDRPPVWPAGLFLIWIAGVFTFGLTLAVRMSRLRSHQRAQKERCTPQWFQELLITTARSTKLKKIPAVVFVENATGPAVYGLFRPTLLLPEGYIEKLSTHQATHVLLHELCHLKRGDLLVHWFSLILQVIYWFNPLLLWTRRQMRHVCEICCDLSVANILREKTIAYRSTILGSARELLAESVDSSLGLLGIFEESFRLVSRLKWLEKNTWKNQKRKMATTVLTGLIMVFCVMPMNGLSLPAAQSESLSAQQANTADNVESGIIQTAESPAPQSFIFIEALIFGVSAETDLDIEGLEMENGQHGASFTECDGITIEGEHYSDLETASQGLSKISGVKILSMSKILTLNNKDALITMRKDPASADYDFFEFLLEITPQLLEDGRINQQIYLEATQPFGDRILTNEDDIELVIQEERILAIGLPFRGTEATTTDKEPLNIYFLVSSHIRTESDIPLPEKTNDPDEDVVYQIDEVDTLPEALLPFSLAYPPEAQENGITGKVIMEIIVTKEGITNDRWIIESEPPGVFDEAALEGVQQWQFVPATRNGELVEVRLPVTLSFEGEDIHGFHFGLNNRGLQLQIGTGAPSPQPESEELREIPHHFRVKFGPDTTQEVDYPPGMPGPAPPPTPQYPLAAARDKIEGRVVMRFLVDTDGKTKNPEVVEADPEGVFEEAMLKNIEQFEFKPATLGGEPVPYMMNYTVEFKLD